MSNTFGDKLRIARLLDDLAVANVHVVTIGQYLQPTARHLEVAEFVHPDLFPEYKQMGYDRGFDFVESGPLVRSSYKAAEFYIEGMLRRRRDAAGGTT